MSELSLLRISRSTRPHLIDITTTAFPKAAAAPPRLPRSRERMMATTSGACKPIRAPDVTHADFGSFQSVHFSDAAVALFESDFLRGNSSQQPDFLYDEAYDDTYEEDDGLGYYSDGVKRTLTDEQIAIFRHSELEAWHRAGDTISRVDDIEPVHEPASATDHASPSIDAEGTESKQAEVVGHKASKDDGEEDGELYSDSPQQRNPAPSNMTKKKKKKKSKGKKAKDFAVRASEELKPGDPGWFKKTVKPDLRKRTWDVVETGMDSLDYDDMETNSGSGAGPAAQRRKISYDD